MDDMKKNRRSQRIRDRGNEEEQLSVYTISRMTRSRRTDVERKATEEENQGGNEDDHNKEKEDVEVDEAEEEAEEEEDGEEEEEEESEGRVDLRQRKTVVRCQAPLHEPRGPRKRSMYFKDHSSPTRCRFSSSARSRQAIRTTSSSSDDDKVQRRRSKSRSSSVDRMKIGAGLADVDPMHIDQTVQELFRMEYGEVFHVNVPTCRERKNFFEDLILNQAAKAPASKKKAGLDAPPPRQLTEEETRKLEKQEEDTLRKLCSFLRDVTNRLSQDKRFKAFTKPVSLNEVPDYTKVIKKPMDLSTVLSNIDRHRYGTVKEFLQDVDLIWQNALEYNPDTDPTDRQIRHKACALKDSVHAIVDDELDEDFEKICVETKASRSTRDCSTAHVLPKQSTSRAEATDLTPQRQPVRPEAAVTPTQVPLLLQCVKTQELKQEIEDFC